jgi:lambda family phage tail tape measure protein
MSIATEIRLRIKAEGEAVLQGLGDKLNKIAANATASSQKFSILAGELRKVEATTGRSTTLLKQYSASWRELAGAVDIASKEFKEATAESARLDAQIAKAEGRNRKAGSRLKTGAQVAGTAVAAGIFGGPEAAIGAVAGGIAGGVPGAQVGAAVGATVSQLRQALGATAAYEAEIKKLEIALKGVTTSQIEYNDALKFIQTSTDNYAVTQDILTRQFTKLQASVQGSGGSLQDTKIAFDGIVSAVRATGGSLQDVDSALTATAQVFSKGKVSAEELRQQIGERLPGAFTLFAKSMDMTPQQLDKALEGGKVSLKDFMVFAKDLFDRYGENAKVIADSPAAAGDRLKIALSNLNKSVGQLLQPIGAAFQDTFGSIAREITRAANALNNFFGIGGEALVNKNTTEINAINIRIRAKERQLKALESKDPSFVGPTPGKKELSFTERATSGAFADDRKRIQAAIDLQKSERERLRKEINDATRNSIVTPTDEGKGLPGIDLDAGKDKKGGRGATAAANALAASKQRAEVLKQEAITLFDMALMQDKIYNLDQKSAKQAILDLTFEKDRLKILGEYDVKATKVDNTANKSAELKALQNKRNVELVALQLKFEAQRAELQREQEETGRKTLEGLQNELDIKKAVTQAERDSLRIAYEMKLLEKGGTVPESDLPRIQALKEQLAAPVLGDDLIRQQIGALSDELLVLTDVGTQVTSVAASIGDAFSTSFKGVISGSMSAREALAGFFRSVADYFLDMAAKIIAKMIQMAILNAIVGVLPGGGGNAASALGSNPNVAAYSSFPTLAKGGTFANGIAKFARGGVVYDPTMFKFAQGGTMRTGLMGEAGPEAIMPLRRGRDGNLGVMSSGGGTTNVVVNVDASGSSVEGDQSQAKALGNAISAAVQSELVKQKRPGGLLA